MIRLQHQIAASPSRVWEAWTRPSTLCLWDPDRVDGELRTGESFVMHWDSLAASIEVQVLARVEGKELRMRFLRADGGAQELQLQLSACGEGETEVRLELRGIEEEDERLGTAAGWHVQLRILERFLSLGPTKRTSFAAMGSVVTSLAVATRALCDLGAWLSLENLQIQQEGQTFSMKTKEGGLAIHGEVIAHMPGREFALWCEELCGVVRARVLPLAFANSYLVGVQVIRWDDAAGAAAIQDALVTAVDGLVASLSGPSGSA